MRRVLVVAVLALAASAVALLVRGGDEDRYRVDAIFDVARGIGPGQLVKIAGAEVGTVERVTLTPDYKARVQMRVDRRFAPFRADASCAIRPEGLISENFVDCRPGTPAAATLAGSTPTVGVAQTSAPVSLQDLFNVWNAPTSQRLSVLVSELGLGLAARGSDVNAILYRANPSLAAARRAIGVVNRQRRQLQDVITRAEPVVTRLAQRSPDVQRFLERTAQLTGVTAARRDDLRAAIRQLPPLLRATRPALAQLDALSTTATPLLRNLRGAAPAVTSVTQRLTSLSTAGVPALRETTGPAADLRAALKGARPVVSALGTFAGHADPAGQRLDSLLVSLRDSGSVESLLRGAYNAAGLTNSFDSRSHVLLGNMSINQCVTYSRVPVAGCDSHLGGGAGSTGPRATRPAAQPGATPRPHRGHRPATAPAPTATPAPAATPKPLIPLLGGLELPDLPVPVPTPVNDLLDYLLGG